MIVLQSGGWRTNAHVTNITKIRNIVAPAGRRMISPFESVYIASLENNMNIVSFLLLFRNFGLDIVKNMNMRCKALQSYVNFSLSNCLISNSQNRRKEDNCARSFQSQPQECGQGTLVMGFNGKLQMKNWNQ